MIVDDDDAFRNRLAQAFLSRDYEVCAFSSANAALAHVTSCGSPELALVDLRMPGEWGLHLVRDLVAIDTTTRIIVFTAYGSIATALEAIRLGATNYLQKPATVEEIELAFDKSDENLQELNPQPTQVPTLARAEWEHINRVLTECNGNIRQAAKLLGLHRRTLQRKLAKFPTRE